MKPATINRHLALLKSALKRAKSNGYAHRDPMQGVKMLAERNARDRICAPAEYERLSAAANPKLRIAILLGYHTGMRLGEIAQLWAIEELTKATAGGVEASLALKRFDEWAKALGRMTLSARAFGERIGRLGDLGVRKGRQAGTGRIIYFGVALKTGV